MLIFGIIQKPLWIKALKKTGEGPLKKIWQPEKRLVTSFTPLFMIMISIKTDDVEPGSGTDFFLANFHYIILCQLTKFQN